MRILPAVPLAALLAAALAAPAAATVAFSSSTLTVPDDPRSIVGASLSLLLNRGDRTFVARKDFAVPAASKLAVGDLDGDHDADIALAGADANVRVMRNNGGGGFGTPITFAAGTPTDVGIGDVDGDGDNDIFVTRDATDSVGVNRLAWNGKAGKKAAAAGSYKVTVAALGADGQRAQGSVALRLAAR